MARRSICAFTNRILVTRTLTVVDGVFEIRVSYDSTELWHRVHTRFKRSTIRDLVTLVPVFGLYLFDHLHTVAVMALLILMRA